MSPEGQTSWVERLARSTAAYDWDEVASVVQQLVRHLRSSEHSVSADEAVTVLSLLRGVRRYADLHAAADALLGHGLSESVVKRQIAQSLVDRDTPATALLVYQSILDDAATPQAERVEALGGVGRCHKQLFVRDSVRSRRQHHLRAAVTAYRQAYDADHRNFWHGINLVALLARADRDALAVEGVDRPGEESRRVAHEILTYLGEGPSGVWELATACEAGVAVGDHDLAIARATMLTMRVDVDAFALASLLRQLLELWQLDTEVAPGSVLVPLLRSAVLGREGGTVVVSSADAGLDRERDLRDYESAGGADLEAVLGRERFKSVTWWLTGLERCRAVARIEMAFSEALGTGFLVAGKELSPDLPEVVLVTNGHVVPEREPYRSVSAVFHGLGADSSTRRSFALRREWWYQSSRAPDLDVTILELDAYPDNVTPVPLAYQMPRLEALAPPRAYVIGHPSGLDTPQFSLQDNALLDYDDRLVHYRSPTEPGSSGSPVFDNTWSLIAVHHAGALEVPRLHGGGTYPANEGISVEAIKGRLRQLPPRGVDIAG